MDRKLKEISQNKPQNSPQLIHTKNSLKKNYFPEELISL